MEDIFPVALQRFSLKLSQCLVRHARA